MNVERHFTVSVYIVHKDKVLLHLHKKYGVILPVGGHLEENELPEEACIREAKEEAGLNIKLYSPNYNVELKDFNDKINEKILISPMHMMLCEVDALHYHIDQVYFAYADSSELSPGKGETQSVFWITRKEVNEREDITSNVRLMALEALDLMAKE
jgi:ADP-ribose pyrophosphatase YjhB (NUDIX family)